MESIFLRFIGESVVHKILGQGTIISCDQKYIYINFIKRFDKTLHFSFPSIFHDERKLLTTNSPILLEYLNEMEQVYTCSRCRKKTEKLKTHKNSRLCAQCITEMTKCNHCGWFFEPNQCKKNTYEKEFCPDCFETTQFLCSKCGEIYPLDERANTFYTDSNDAFCEQCAEWEYDHCFLCSCFLSGRNIKTVDDNSLCPDCYESRTAPCEVCGIRTLVSADQDKTICYACETNKMYDEYINSLNFSKLACHEVSFEEFRNSKTLKLMSRLRRSYGETPVDKSKTPIDVLFLKKHFGTLVVVWDCPARLKAHAEYSCTLTYLKRNDVWHIFHNGTTIVSRVIPLADGAQFNVWQYPYKLRAQTKSDMDYGDCWEGAYLVHEGNKYGDTSDFLILGYIDKIK